MSELLPNAVAILIKALTYAASLSAAGGVLFLLLCWQWIPATTRHPICRNIKKLVLCAGLFSVMRIAMLLYVLGGEWAALHDWPLLNLLLQSGEGDALLLRMLGLSLIALGLAKQPQLFIASLGATAVACSFALTGHSAEATTASHIALAQILLALHLIAVAFWLGSLYPLHCLCQSAPLGQLTLLLQSFSRTAFVMIGVLAATGLGLLITLLGETAPMPLTDYSKLMLLKLLLVGAMLLLAALNKWRLTPRLAEANVRQALIRAIKFEIAAAGLILIVTATLTTMTGPQA